MSAYVIIIDRYPSFCLSKDWKKEEEKSRFRVKFLVAVDIGSCGLASDLFPPKYFWPKSSNNKHHSFGHIPIALNFNPA